MNSCRSGRALAAMVLVGFVFVPVVLAQEGSRPATQPSGRGARGGGGRVWREVWPHQMADVVVVDAEGAEAAAAAVAGVAAVVAGVAALRCTGAAGVVIRVTALALRLVGYSG